MQDSGTKRRSSRMKKFFLGVVLIAFLIAVVFLATSWPSQESREAAYWINGSAWMDPQLSWEENAQRRLEALKQMGQPAVRVLVNDLRRGDDENRTYLSLFKAMPRGLQRILPRPQLRVGSRHGAALLLSQLGPPAKEAVPDLLELLRSGDRFGRHDAVRALGGIGDNTPTVLSSLTNLYADPAVEVRKAAAVSVWRLDHADAHAAFLIESMLTNTNRERLEATGADCYYDLMTAGPEAKRFGPSLAEGMTNVPSLTAKTLAAKTLWRIEGSPGGALYALSAITNALGNAPIPPNNPQRPDPGAYGELFLAAQELMEIREFRLAVEPYLSTLTNSPNRTITEMASDHLKRIGRLNSTNGASR